jgi:hypothetical protein
MPEPTPPPFPKTQQPAPHPAPAAEQGERFSPQEIAALRELRVLEERFRNLRRKAQLADDNLLALEQQVKRETAALTAELSAMRHDVRELTDTIAQLKGEVAHAAPIRDLRALEKYVGYWEPLGFVTEAELRRQNLFKGPGSQR